MQSPRLRRLRRLRNILLVVAALLAAPFVIVTMIARAKGERR